MSGCTLRGRHVWHLECVGQRAICRKVTVPTFPPLLPPLLLLLLLYSGFALCGFGMGEHFSARPKLLSAALQHLPADKPRVVVGLVRPLASGDSQLMIGTMAGLSCCAMHLENVRMGFCCRLTSPAWWWDW
jgi:hypothetical protein